MLYTISIIAQKGGSGKTTLALTLAVAVEQASRTAVVLDIDSQATACKWSARRAAETPLVLAVQPARLPGAIATAAAHDVDVVVIDTSARSEAACPPSLFFAQRSSMSALIDWDRLPTETPKSYAAFLAYVALGARRSVREAARQHHVKTVTLAACRQITFCGALRGGRFALTSRL